jgi:hypothetical protein
MEQEQQEQQEQQEYNKPNYNLLFSTSTFIFPLLYAYRKNNIVLSTATSIALLGSLNHWRNPKPGYRRTSDLITSNMSLVAYFYYGHTNIISLYPRLLGYTYLSLMTYLYNKSYTKFYLHDKTWENYHVGFHLLTTISKMYVIYWV